MVDSFTILIRLASGIQLIRTWLKITIDRSTHIYYYIRINGYSMSTALEHEIFKAMSEPMRLRILALLTKRELCVCDLVAVLNQPQSTISRHMARLRAAGMVADRREGLWVHYRLLADESPLFADLKSILIDLTQKEPYSKDIELLRIHLEEKNRC